MIIRKQNFGCFSHLHLVSTSSSIIFESHALLYGKHFRIPSFDYPQKPLKFILPDFNDADAIFISSSESFGALFLKRNMKIYMTRPVYEQLLLKYYEYMSLSIYYDDLNDEEIYKMCHIKPLICNNCKINPICRHMNHYIKSLDDIDIKRFSKQVVFINYNQILQIGGLKITVQSPGTFIGWCNFKIMFENLKTLLLINSYSLKKRFSIGCANIKSDYLIINRPSICKNNEIKELTEFINNYSISELKHPIVIPIDFECSFLEIIFHVLSLISDSQMDLTVISKIFNRLDLVYNIQSEWLNSKFYSISEPFPLKKYKNLSTFDSWAEFNFPDSKNIIFCDKIQFEIYKNRECFNKFTIVELNFKDVNDIIDNMIRVADNNILDDSLEQAKRFKITEQKRYSLI